MDVFYIYVAVHNEFPYYIRHIIRVGVTRITRQGGTMARS